MSLGRLLAAGFATAAFLVVPAEPASAHAVLLRTTPSPQTTVASPPSAIHLFFSEPADAVFGGVRVFDVDGTRVAAGEARHPGGDRNELAVSLPRLANGTYTVTWRVVSDDGHPVRGGFVFYVGAPSAISAVAVAGENAAGGVVGWGAGALRWAWYLAIAALVGAVTVRRWVWTPAAAAVGGPSVGRQYPLAADFRRRLRILLPGAWVVLLGAGAASLVFQAAKVSGLALADAARPDVLREVMDTSFGRIWVAKMALTTALVVPVVTLARRRSPRWLSPGAWMVVGAAIVGALIVTGAMGGHARTDSSPAWAVASVSLHLGAVSVWFGGLLVLVAVGGPVARGAPADLRRPLLLEVLRRFSPLAAGAVVVIIATGVVNSFFELASLSDLWRLSYGRTLVAKVLALGVALGLAARHRFVLPRRLQADAEDPSPVLSFRRSSIAELTAMGLALSLAAGLVDMVPGRTVALAAKGPVSQERKIEGFTVQLFLDPTQAGENDVHVTFVDSRGLAAAEIVNAEVELGPEGAAPAPVRMRILSPGHFVGQADLPRAGPYRLTVRSPRPSGDVATTFTFRMSESLYKEKNE